MLHSSVVMCTYKGAKFLQEQLESLVSQTRLPDELVVCDDCSTDETVEILENFARTAPFSVRIYRNEKNLGYIRNFEKCALLASADILFLCDQDDVWHASKIQKIMQIFEEKPDVGCVIHGNQCITAEGTPRETRFVCLGTKKDISREKLQAELEIHSTRSFIHEPPRSWSGCCMAYRRKYNEILVPFIPDIYHDMWIINCLGVYTNFFFLDEDLIFHRLHSENATYSPYKKKFSRFWGRLWNSIRKRGKKYLFGKKEPLFLKIRETLLERLSGRQDLAHPELLKEWTEYRS